MITGWMPGLSKARANSGAQVSASSASTRPQAIVVQNAALMCPGLSAARCTSAWPNSCSTKISPSVRNTIATANAPNSAGPSRRASAKNTTKVMPRAAQFCT
jgi:hypothetical protein